MINNQWKISFIVLLVFSPLSIAQTRSPTQPPLNPNLPTLWLIGDSTVKNGQDTGSNGQWGWGHLITFFFDKTRINVQNRALGGTSSRSFRNQGLWGRILTQMKPGDFVIMQFGTNDGGLLDDPQRPRGSLRGDGEETRDIINPQTQKPETVHTYGWYLRQYVAEAKQKGAAEFVVCSLVPRNIWSDGKVEPTTQYPLWASQAAQQSGAEFVDLHAIIARHYEELGREKVTAEIFPPGGEHTHTTWAGALLSARSVVEGIKSLDHSKLADYLLADPSIPAPPTTSPAH